MWMYVISSQSHACPVRYERHLIEAIRSMRFILLGETSCISPYTILEYSHPQSTSASSMPSSLAPRFAIALQFQAGYIKNASPGKASSNSLALISRIDQLLKACHLGHRHQKDYAADRFLTNRGLPPTRSSPWPSQGRLNRNRRLGRTGAWRCDRWHGGRSCPSRVSSSDLRQLPKKTNV